jgi:mutator family transposase
MTELKSRGVDDVLVALVDGLIGFPEAIITVFSQAQVHHCVVHFVRKSLAYASWKDCKQISAALRAIYRAPTEAAAEAALETFRAGPWGTRYPAIGALWARHWPHVRPVFAYPAEIRRLLYTTSAIESLHHATAVKSSNRGHFPTDAAASKCSTSRYATSRANGDAAITPGKRRCPIFPSCSARASPSTRSATRRFTHKLSYTSAVQGCKQWFRIKFELPHGNTLRSTALINDFYLHVRTVRQIAKLHCQVAIKSHCDN